jgi:hypothetical protein
MMPRKITPPLSEALVQYQRTRSVHVARSTLINDQSVLRRFVEGVGDPQVHGLSSAQAEDWFHEESTRQGPSSYEGEGSLVFRRDRRTLAESWELCLSSTDQDVITRAQEVATVGAIDFRKRQKPQWKDQWRWRVSKRAEIAQVAATLLPYLGERRSARIEDFLNWYQANAT